MFCKLSAASPVHKAIKYSSHREIMHSIETDDELILTFGTSDVPRLRRFLESLELEYNEVLEHFAGDQLRKQHQEEVHVLETEQGERIIVVFGRERMHVFLKKNQYYEQVREKFFEYISY